MKPIRIHILFEYGVNLRPHASASLRLIRPLTHPMLRDKVVVTAGRSLVDEAVDVVLVDRLWRPDIQPAMVDDLVNEVHRRGARLVYWFDDNFLLLRGHAADEKRYRECFQLFLALSDGVIVSSSELKKTFEGERQVVFLPSALDERLIVLRQARRAAGDRIRIGYMGTSTHDEDLRMVLPALRTVCNRYPDRIRLQFTGVLTRETLERIEELGGLPVEIINPSPVESEYQAFLLWFTGEVRWDIGIAPLVNNEFNRFKSDIKFLDYTAAAIPGIYSDVPAYVGTVKNYVTGVLVDDSASAWTAALERLIEDEPLRLKLVDNASRYLYEERILAKCADLWLPAIQEALGGSWK